MKKYLIGYDIGSSSVKASLEDLVAYVKKQANPHRSMANNSFTKQILNMYC